MFMHKNTCLFHRAMVVALMICLGMPQLAVSEEADGQVRYRALLIACDQFVEATEMTPIGENNLRIMETMLSQDTRGFEIKRQYGITSSVEALSYAIDWAFSEATENDVSILYISTHGDFVTTHNNPHGELLLSDGSLEDRVTADELNRLYDRVAGTKVLLVDACNSGALIGKGVSPDVGSARVGRTFQAKSYKVLTSSGASEPSWYLLPTLEHAPPGSSYFTTAMAVGAGLIGGYAADANRDGTITLSEMYNHLWVAQASSAVQMYPQDDAFPLFVYDKARLQDDVHGELTGFVFSDTPLDRARPILDFSYTVTANTTVAYRITYLRDGQWDWVHGETLRDATEWDGDADPLGHVSPGRKQIRLDLTELLPDDWTYAMIHVMTIGNVDEGKQPFIYASRVLRAQMTDTDPGLKIRASMRWDTKTRRELEVFVAHTVPCNLSVYIEDTDGKLVRRLITSQATRPQALTPNGSLLYWNGLNTKGERVQPGEYRIVAKARVDDHSFTAEATVTVDQPKAQTEG